jgi:metallo-beta-lactamase family protein
MLLNRGLIEATAREAWFDRVGDDKKRVFLVHGEPERSQKLCDALNEKHPNGKTEVARMLQTVEL